MDHFRFDTLAKQISVLRSRREGLRILLTAIATGALGFPAATEASDCQGKGYSCEKNEDCCSRICRFSGFGQREVGQAGQAGQAGQHGVAAERRGKKGQKGQKCKRGKKGRIGTERRDTCKGGKKGTCDCSRLKDRCNVASDCCFEDQACETNGCDEHKVCCKKAGDPCADDCDCCGERSFCGEESGRCEDCGEKKLTQEGPCENDEDCCFDDDICASIFPTCEGRQGDKQCCVPKDKECGEDCDCCTPLKCVDGKCATSCGDSGERQRNGGGRVAGEGAGATPCPPGDPVLCCQEGETCCALDGIPVCCPMGTACTEYGCMPPCPNNHDACGTSELSCGEGPQFLGCKCIRWDDRPFCARLAVCTDCQEDADCGHPSAICIPCERCAQANPDSPNGCVFPCVTFLG